MKFNKIDTFLFQFGILNAIRFFVAEVCRKILDPYNITSYAQTGEDRILESILGENSIMTGFYVDVGCNHPQLYSNTFALYKRGWNGITIDANRDLIQLHQKLRKRDITVCAAVSDQEKEMIFTDFEESLVSSLTPANVSEWSKRSKIKQQRVVNTVTLASILDQHKVSKDFELLCIDVEGHDFEVLTSLDFSKYRPKLIIIEILIFDLTNPSSSKIYAYLVTNKYKMIGYVLMNCYFLDTFI